MSIWISTVSLRVRNPCNDNYQSWGMVVSGSLLPTDFIHSILNRIHHHPKDWRRWTCKPSDHGCATGKFLNASRLAMSKAWSMLKRQLGSGKISHPFSFGIKLFKKWSVIYSYQSHMTVYWPFNLHNLGTRFQGKRRLTGRDSGLCIDTHHLRPS